MPLRVIRAMLDDGARARRALIELEDRILERALASAEQRGGGRRVSAKEIRERYDIPQQRARAPGRDRRADALPAAATGPTTCRSSRRSAASAPAATTRRSGSPSTTPCATARRSSRSSQEEVRALLDRLAGEVEVERAHEIIEAGAEPLRELIGAIHSKLLLAELARQRGR